MAKLKLPQFGHLMRRAVGNDPDAGKDRGQEEKGKTKDEMVGWHHHSANMRLIILQEIGKDRAAWHAAVRGVTKRHNLATEE